MSYEYNIVVIDEYGNYTRTIEKSSLSIDEFATFKLNEGYDYNLTIGYILLLTKHRINFKIQDVLKPDEIDSESWDYEKNTYGEYWNTYREYWSEIPATNL